LAWFLHRIAVTNCPLRLRNEHSDLSSTKRARDAEVANRPGIFEEAGYVESASGCSGAAYRQICGDGIVISQRIVPFTTTSVANMQVVSIVVVIAVAPK